MNEYILDMKKNTLLLGFDFGMKNIGISIGQTITKQARALSTIKANNGSPDWSIISNLITKWQPEAIIIGLPLNMDGSPSEMSIAAERFARRIKGRFNIKVFTHDERLTSFEAKQNHQSTNHQNIIDSIAASLILESWMQQYL